MYKIPDRSTLITLLRWVGKFIPGDYLKTAFYLNIIARPRKGLNHLLNSFYRMDHIYDVLKEFKETYNGKFSILEFGTAGGYSFTKMLYATKYLRMIDRVMVHAFDSFEGLPAPTDPSDQAVTGYPWAQGQYRGNYQELYEYCHRHYSNYQIHKGYFEETLTDEVMNLLKIYMPILVWIDCDYYNSTRSIFERLVSSLPNGCVVYFDDYDFNFGSKLTGEAKIVYEVNHGLFGDGIELVLDRNLSMDSNRVYRFINLKSGIQYKRLPKGEWVGRARRRTNDSPLP